MNKRKKYQEAMYNKFIELQTKMANSGKFFSLNYIKAAVKGCQTVPSSSPNYSLWAEEVERAYSFLDENKPLNRYWAWIGNDPSEEVPTSEFNKLLRQPIRKDL